MGIALSKFSVGIPLLIFLLYKRKWATLAVAMGVQVAGFIAIAILRSGSPLDVFADFASIAASHSSFSGIHLTELFSPTILTSVIIGAIFSIACRFSPRSGSHFKAQGIGFAIRVARLYSVCRAVLVDSPGRLSPGATISVWPCR